MFTSLRNGSIFTNNSIIRDVKRELNGSQFWCVDITTFNPQVLTLIDPQCLSTNKLLTF